MSDFVLVDGDRAEFSPTFGSATVAVQPGTLTATGAPFAVAGKKTCVQGDEKSVSVPGCSYVTASHPIPGTGTLEVASLGGDQIATKTSSGGGKVLLVGSGFTASFSVQSPAQQPTSTGPVPDPMSSYSGTGGFITSNSKLRGV